MNGHLKRVLILLLIFTFVFQMAGVTSLSRVQAYADTETAETVDVPEADEAEEMTTEEIDTESPGEIETDGENPPDAAEEPADPETVPEETAEVPEETAAEETVTVEEPTESAEAKAPVLKAAGTKAEKTGTVLAFTSDTHNKSGNVAANRLGTWIKKVESIHGDIDVMAFGGDMAGAGASGYWDLTQADMKSVSDNGVIGVYTTGNHEISAGGDFKYSTYTSGGYSSTETKGQFEIDTVGAEGDDYIIYCLGSQSSSSSYTNQVSSLTSFLNNAGNNKPIFIITHFPLHYYSGRSTTDASKVIDALNTAVEENGQTIVFLWGHNHTMSDTYYDQIYGPGGVDSIQYGSSSNNKKTIKFYYGAAGCMSDEEYSGANTGSASVKGKGLAVTITPNGEDSTMEFHYYNVDGTDVKESNSVKSVDVEITEPVPATGVTIKEITTGNDGQPVGKSIAAGKTLQLHLTLEPTGASSSGITWSTSDESVATVSNSGLVTAKKEGTATITAAVPSGTKAAPATSSIEITVTAAPKEVSITPTSSNSPEENATIDVGETLTINVTNSSTRSGYTFAATLSKSGVAEFQGSSSVEIAQSSTGQLTVKGLANGTVDINITNNNSSSERKAVVHLTVGDGGGDDPTPTGKTVDVTPNSTTTDEESITIDVDETFTINVTNGSTSSAYNFTATLSKEGVAEIQGNSSINIEKSSTGQFTVKGIANGTVDINIQNDGQYSTRKAIVHLTVGDGGGDDPAPTTNSRYVFTSTLEAGGEYIIVNDATVGSSSSRALKNPGGSSSGVAISASNGKTNVTVQSGDYIETSDTDIVWTAEANGNGFNLKNNGDYLEQYYLGNRHQLVVFNPIKQSDRYWTYSNSNLKHNGGSSDYYINYSNGTFAVTTTASTVYLFRKQTGDTVAVTNVTLDKSTLSLEAGQTGTLTATVAPENATNTNVTWSTSDANVATVSNGTVTAVAAGTATITVTTADGGKTATCAVTVTGGDEPGENVEYVPADTLVNGKDYVIANGQTGSVYVVSNTVTGSGDNAGLAGISANVVDGKITLSAANATKAAFNTEIKSSTSGAVSAWLKQGDNYLYTASRNGLRISNEQTASGNTGKYWHYKADDKNLLWFFADTSSSDGYTDTSSTYKYYLNSSSGNFTAEHVSTTSLADSNTPAIYLFVRSDQAVPADSVTLDKTSTSAVVGDTVTLNAAVAPDGVTYRALTWTSSDTSVATVKDGVVTAVAAGTATITVTTASNKIATCTVTVTAPAVDRYVKVDSIKAGGEYIITNDATVGGTSTRALKNPGGTSGGNQITANNGKTTVKILEGNIIETTDTDIVWKAEANGDGFNLTNDECYIEGSGGNSIKSYKPIKNPDRYWTYSNEQLFHHNGTTSTYTVNYANGTFTATTNSSDYKIYIFEKITDTPHTHTYGEPTWTWAEDHTSATAKFTCTECDDTQTVTDNAPVETEVTAAGCETNKVIKYTATVTFEEKTYTDTTDNVTVEGTATGHDYGDATYEWAADNSSVTGTRVCSNDANHTITETVNTTSEITKAATCEGKGETTYTAAFTKEGFTTQTKTVENIDALGHDYGNATYEWADNNASVTGTRVCSHDATHTITETVNTTSEITKPATCEGKGETTYTATFTKEGFATQTKTVENINALGHDYGAPVWDWDGVTAAKATFTCGNDPTHQVTENAIITNAQGTGEKEGYTVYTATVTFNEETYTDTKDVINQYTLTFKNGDEVVATITEDYGTTITAPAAPTKPFYTFNGWTPTVPETMPAENKTFTATWTAKEAYYLIGSMTEWKVVEANEFVANPDNPAEYSVAATLAANDEIKVVKAVAGEAVNTEYYPSTEHPGANGQTDNYIVDQYHAGNVTVYFRPAGNSDAGWQDFGGYFYIEGDHAITVKTSPADAGTATVVRGDGSGSATSAPKGMALTVNTAPADNYQLDKIEIWKTNGGTAAEQTLEGNTFNMPDYDVTVKVYFKAITWTFVDFTWEQTADGYNAIANYRGDNGSTKTVAATVTSRITTAATCEGEGQIVYTATVTAADSLDGTAQSEDKPVTIPAAGHEYGDLIPEVAATCTKDGMKAHYECSVCHKLFDTNRVETTAEALKITATGHDWEFVDFSWTGYTAAIANYKCKNDATHTQTVNATVTSVTTPATCETAGKTVYTATVAAADSLDGKAQTADKTVTIPAIEHDWEFTDFTWTGSDEAGYTAAAANYKCKNDATHTQTVNATVTSVTTAATCEVAGKTVYTATVAAADSLDGKAQTADKTVTIPATGHNWSAPEWTWIGNDTDGYTGVKATFTCTNNSQHTQTVESDNVSVTGRVEPTPETNGSITYSASITGPDNRVYSIQKEIIIPATGYSFEDPEYTWAETADGYTCTALMACKEDHTKDITETVPAAYRVAAAPTCEGKGTGIYTATFTNSKFVTQYKEVEIAATGHDWNDPTDEWNNDHTSVDMTFTCKNDPTHIHTETVNGSAITSEITTEPTATEPGVKTYTATVTLDGKTYTVTDTEAIPATGTSVSGSITSFVGNTEEGQVTVQLFAGESETAAYTAKVTSNTSYAFEGVADGTYTMKVSKKDHVARSYEITVSGNAVTQDVKIHLIGDINGDGDVTTVDAARVNSHAKGKTLLTGYEFSCGDINGDGDITTVDAARTNAHAKGASLIW